MSAPICINCNAKACWYDDSRKSYSNYCSNTCRSSVQQPTYTTISSQKRPPTYYGTHAIQGQPICQMCNNAAYYDGYKYSPGCGRGHAQQAIAKGFTGPR